MKSKTKSQIVVYAPGVTEKTYIICSRKDEVIPYKLAIHLSTCFNGNATVEVDEEMRHNDLYNSDEVWKKLLTELEK